MNFLSRMRRPKAAAQAIDISEIKAEPVDLAADGRSEIYTLSLHGIVVGKYYRDHHRLKSWVSPRGGDKEMGLILKAWADDLERKEREEHAKERERWLAQGRAERAADAEAMWDAIERAKR